MLTLYRSYYVIDEYDQFGPGLDILAHFNDLAHIKTKLIHKVISLLEPSKTQDHSCKNTEELFNRIRFLEHEKWSTYYLCKETESEEPIGPTETSLRSILTKSKDTTGPTKTSLRSILTKCNGKFFTFDKFHDLIYCLETVKIMKSIKINNDILTIVSSYLW